MNSKPDYDRLYEIAENQAGYFTARQARQAGFSWERLSNNARNGKFMRVAQGIYRLSHFPNSANEDLYVAQLRTGPDSVISHESALALYDLADVLPTQVHLIVPRTASRRRRGIKLHTNELSSKDIVKREGLKVTSVARTIADIIDAGLPDEQVYDAIGEALARGLTSPEELLQQAKNRKGRVERLIQRTLQKEIK